MHAEGAEVTQKTQRKPNAKYGWLSYLRMFFLAPDWRIFDSSCFFSAFSAQLLRLLRAYSFFALNFEIS
jgi:hypothetical protein